MVNLLVAPWYHVSTHGKLKHNCKKVAEVKKGLLFINCMNLNYYTITIGLSEKYQREITQKTPHDTLQLYTIIYLSVQQYPKWNFFKHVYSLH